MTALFWTAWVLAAAVAVTAISIWAVRSREATLEAARGDVVRVARQGATYVGNVVGLADEILARLSVKTSESDLNNMAFDRLCPSLVCADYGRSAKAMLIAFARSNGDVVVAGTDAPPASLADRDYFLALKAADVGLFIGKPRKNRIVDGTYLPMGRRLAPGDGAFHGIVAAAVNVDLIRVFFQGLGVGAADQIALRDAAGDAVVGWPAETDTAGAGPACGEPRDEVIAASEKLRIGGLSVEVCRSAGSALRLWHGQVLLTAGGASLLLLASALAFPAIRRRWERRIRQQQGLRGLVVEAFDVQFIIAAKSDGTFVLEALTFNRGSEWSEASARLVGRSTRELFPPEEADQMEAEYRSVLASGETRRSERRVRLGAARFVWSTVLVPLSDTRGGTGYIFGAATDLCGDGTLEGGLRRFTENVLRREDNERRRIARELHDTTGQNLIAAGFELGTVARGLADAPPPVIAALAQARKLVDDSVAELRTLSYVLYPPLLDEAGLGLALTTLAEGFGKRAGLSVTVSVAEDVAGRRWAPEIELALYRVAQESLTNVQRHSPRQAAYVVLRTGASGHLELDITNEPGAVFTEEARLAPIEEGAGIRGMRDRLETLGGSLTVIRCQGDFRVAATLPVEPLSPA